MSDSPRAKASEFVTVEIFNQQYHLSGQDPAHIRALAARVDAKMRAVAAQGRTVDSLRVAVLAALNLADEVEQLIEHSRKPRAATTPAAPQSGRARAQKLRGLLDELLDEERKTGS